MYRVITVHIIRQNTMEKYLFGAIGILLASIAGIGAYEVVQNPSQAQNLVPAAAQALQRATLETGVIPSASSDTVTSSPTPAQTPSEDASDDAEEENTTSITKPAPKNTVTQPKTAQAPGTYTMSQINAHSTPASCYTTINGDVYDLTSFIARHPGGEARIISICGIDGTSAFEGQHGGDRKPEAVLASFKIGTLAQ
jgi:cytochrome b involved in lipid metabolism